MVFVYPSFFEGFGLPPLEAQSCGVPVVSSNRTSLPEILQNSALLIDPWSVEEIYMSIKSILENEILRKQLILRGQENVKRFNWQKTANQFIELINKI
ncbi:MAG: hypothetical protein COV57_02590 [Candidatus Liptonbacteria bacterium CG11_big_fil_rev_8_21_14_0_20_35_14]|uniref:Glycosyl transferase family 1 domain-containing protein n=1 Tax=Candidatus Liptonbacteria bacterium CG11_big_fil_rev_8_21_14_0_20_35_14 TaxID=1974634 RepID=A0A2H0N9K7_9BACT|nr:MAG: hypothetical protein COV57_02590 [Candidatus Liptonbacteria bacterium CG11_big_fil_rev_8_21_14_0_20_35_14]